MCQCCVENNTVYFMSRTVDAYFFIHRIFSFNKVLVKFFFTFSFFVLFLCVLCYLCGE